MTTNKVHDTAAKECSLTIRMTTDPGLQVLQRVIDVLAINDITPRSIVSDHQIGTTKLTLQFFDPPPRLQQVRMRVETIVGVRQIDR